MKRLYVFIKDHRITIYNAVQENLIEELYDKFGFGFENDIYENATVQDVYIAIAEEREDAVVRILDVTNVACVEMLLLCHRFDTEIHIM